MASFNRVTFGGSSDTISVPFSYLDKTHVQVYLGGVLLSSSAYTWPSSGQVKITAGNPAAGVIGEVRRVTPITALVNFQPGNLDTNDLNVASLQPIFIAEEAKDNTTDIVNRAWYTNNFQTGGTITKGGAGSVPSFDASGNLSTPIPADAIMSAQGYAQDAYLSKQAAAGSATAAFGSETNAAASAVLAGKWASNPEDAEVIPSSGLFSAFHWYRKTLAIWTSVVAGFAAAIHAAAAKFPMAGADELGFWDSVSGLLRKISMTDFRKTNNLFFADVSDPTKRLSFDLSAITTGIGRSLAVPDRDGSILFVREYISGQQVITTGGALTLAHGLGVAPKLIMPVLICTTAENGYAVGDIVPANPSVATAANNDFGAMFEISGTTNILVRFGSAAQSFLGTHKTTGAMVGMTGANWRLIMRAWA